MKKKQCNKQNNIVAKHARKFNKSAVMVDRKKESKKTGKYLDSLVYAF